QAVAMGQSRGQSRGTRILQILCVLRRDYSFRVSPPRATRLSPQRSTVTDRPLVFYFCRHQLHLGRLLRENRAIAERIGISLLLGVLPEACRRSYRQSCGIATPV